MANSANPEINKKIATSALGTLVIATVFFYLGDRYAETLVTYPGQIFDHLSDAFLSMWQTISSCPTTPAGVLATPPMPDRWRTCASA